MSVVEVAINLAGLVVLVVYLCTKHRQKARGRGERYDSADWSGTAIDVTKLKPAIDARRREYVAAQQRGKGFRYHRALLEFAGRAIAQLGYFRDRKAEVESHTRKPL
jgi:hypothetical protein